jgi:hypothetical protein
MKLLQNGSELSPEITTPDPFHPLESNSSPDLIYLQAQKWPKIRISNRLNVGISANR